MYATLKDVEKDQAEDAEGRRASQMTRHQAQDGLFHIKRLGGIHFWLLKLFEHPVESLIRIERIKKPAITMASSLMHRPKAGGRFW